VGKVHLKYRGLGTVTLIGTFGRWVVTMRGGWEWLSIVSNGRFLILEMLNLQVVLPED
jgi:hypothetical protein